MAKLEWDKSGERLYETGVSRGILFKQSTADGAYEAGIAWNGLTGVTESPTGAEPNPQYADNMKYLNLMSIEEFEGTIEAFMYPSAFGECDGSATLSAGITVGQQTRKPFGLSYETIVGNDLLYNEYGKKIHLIYGILVSPSERAYATVNDSPEAIPFSWPFTTTPVDITAEGFKPTAILVIDTTDPTIDKEKVKTFEDILYGTADVASKLLLPDEVLAHFSAAAPTPPAEG